MAEVSTTEVAASTNNAEVRETIREYVLQVLKYGNTWDVILRAVEAAPNCILVHLLHADFKLAGDDFSAVIAALDKAKTLKEASVEVGYNLQPSVRLNETNLDDRT